jgi:hypothetical protein
MRREHRSPVLASVHVASDLAGGKVATQRTPTASAGALLTSTFSTFMRAVASGSVLLVVMFAS